MNDIGVLSRAAQPDVVKTDQPQPSQAWWLGWWNAFKEILSLYIAVHLAFLIISCLAVLFLVKDFAMQGLPLSTIWRSWYHWDTAHYMAIALHGYTEKTKTAFFPLYPLLERGLIFLGIKPLTAALLISNIADLVLLVVIYRLVLEDFDKERAFRTVLYLSLFPTAFFLVAGYNESLFICLELLSLYQIRRGNWWLAGLFGGLASLTRSTGLLFVLPFCYEYFQQHDFQLRKIRFNILGSLLIPGGTALYCLYCYGTFHDFLAFSHAEVYWDRALRTPWHGIIGSFKAIIMSPGLLSFQALRNLTDLGPDLFILALIILGIVGPWKFPARLRVYSVYAVAFYLFPHFFPHGGTGIFPLESMSRYVLEIVPAFIVLVALGKRFRAIDLSYLMVSGATLFFLLAQFLTGHWVL